MRRGVAIALLGLALSTLGTSSLAWSPVVACGSLRFRSQDWNLYADDRAAQEGDETRCKAVVTRDREVFERLKALDGKRVCVHAVPVEVCGPSEVCLYHCPGEGLDVRRVYPEPRK